MRQKIKSIVNGLDFSPAYSFYYGLKSFQNIQDDCTFPIVFCDPIIDNPEIRGVGVLEHNYKVSLFFGDISEYDNTYEQHLTIIDAIRPAVNDFIRTLRSVNDSIIVKEISSIDIREAINVFDSNITGLIVSMNVKCTINEGVCV